MADSVRASSPEELLEKLKKIKKAKEKEIKEAEKKIKDTEQELNQQQEWREKVPIPQVAAESLDGLSEEEKLILEVHKGLKQKEGDEQETPTRRQEQNLEDTVQELAPPQTGQLHEQRDTNAWDATNTEYLTGLSQEPMQSLYHEMSNLYEGIKDKGYVSSAEQQRMQTLSSAIERKLEDVQAGDYSMSGQVAKEASLAVAISGAVSNLYSSSKADKKNMNDWYQ